MIIFLNWDFHDLGGKNKKLLFFISKKMMNSPTSILVTRNLN
jgi:hypothetical protein